MPSSNNLSSLIKYLDRVEWRDCFSEVVEAHFGAVLEAAGIEFIDLADILGPDIAMTLWGCAFEAFLTHEFGGKNIVDTYLKKRGWKETTGAKAYMKALRTSIMSLYEVSDIVAGQSFMARDLIRGGDPVMVHEMSATKTLKPWDRIAARIVELRGKTVMCGGLLPFSQKNVDLVFAALGEELGEGFPQNPPFMDDETLHDSAPLLSMIWLTDMLGRAMGGAMPEMENSDGDGIVFHDLRFPFKSGIRQKDVAVRLNGLSDLRQENEKFWNWLGGVAEGLVKASAEGRLALDTTMDDGMRVLGNLELKGRILVLSVNSARRAEKGEALIRDLLGDFVGDPDIETRSIAEVMAERDGEVSKVPDMSPEIAEQLVHDYLDQRYRNTLDQPVGMLDDETPREAVTSTQGRAKAAEWLKYLENQSLRNADPSDPMATYDFGWMWRELGIQALRR